MQIPPLASTICAVIHEPSSEASDRAAFAMSSGSPTRPKAVLLAKKAIKSGVMALASMSVRVVPGDSVFEVMPRVPSSGARAKDMLLRAALVIEYADEAG